MSLFPLPLTGFEHYMLADDSVDYPSIIWMGLTFDRHLDRDCLTKAIEILLSRQPMLRAYVEGSINDKTSQLVWRPQPDPLDIVWLDRSEIPTNLPSLPIDLQDRNGIRFIVTNDQRCTKVWLQVHHSCCDGIGCSQICDELVHIYNSIYDSNKHLPSLAPIDESLLQYRDKYNRTVLAWASSPYVYARHVARYILRKCHPMALPGYRQNKSETNQHPCFSSSALAKEVMSRLKIRCRRIGVTLNDLFLQKWFLAVHDWNIKYCPDRALSIRMLMPVDMRRLSKQYCGALENADRGVPVCAMTGFVFIHPHINQLSNPQDLLNDVNRFTSYAKLFGHKHVFTDALRYCGRYKNGIVHYLSPDICHATSAMSNVGIFLKGSSFADNESIVKFGDARLIKIEGMAPVRPLTHAACTAITYAGQLFINVLVDPWLLKEEDADFLLTSFLGYLEEEASLIT